MEKSNDKKFYLEYVPKELKSIVKKNNCKYDNEVYKWFTTDEDNQMIQDFSKQFIDFWELMNELSISFDQENKKWYTFKSNEKIHNKYFL